MATKLESLVKMLGNSVEQNIIDQLVLDYYTNQNSSVFVTEQVEYEVLTEREKDELLYDIAEGLYSDYEQTLINLVNRMYSQERERVILLTKSIDEEKATQFIANELVYEEEFGKVLIGSDHVYDVFIDE